MKQIKLLTLILMSYVGVAQAQEGKDPAEKIPALKGLVALDESRLTRDQQKSFAPDKTVYFEDGTILTPDQYKEKLEEGYITIPYAKKENINTIEAKLVRTASDKEKEAMLYVAPNEALGSIAPAIMGTDMNGKPFDLANCKGKVAALIFWFMGSELCTDEAPALNKLVDAYKGKNVEFIVIALDKKEQVSKILQTTPLKCSVIPDSGSTNKWIVNITPTHVVVDKEGKIISWEIGQENNSFSKTTEKIEEALKK